MPVDEKILDDLCTLYHDYHMCTTSEQKQQFFEKNRKSIKIIVDSLYEQVIENITGIKPKHVPDARMQLNAYVKKHSTGEKVVILEALKGVLKEYDTITAKMYVDIAKNLTHVLVGGLKSFCITLCVSSALKTNAKGQKLLKELNRE